MRFHIVVLALAVTLLAVPSSAALCATSKAPPKYPTGYRVEYGDPLVFSAGGSARAVAVAYPYNASDSWVPYSFGYDISENWVRYPVQDPLEYNIYDSNCDDVLLPKGQSDSNNRRQYCLSPPNNTAGSLFRPKIRADYSCCPHTISLTITWGTKSDSDTIPSVYLPNGFVYDDTVQRYRFLQDSSCKSSQPSSVTLEVLPGIGRISGYHIDVPRSLFLSQTTKCFAIPTVKQQIAGTYLPSLWCLRSYVGFYRLTFEGFQYKAGSAFSLRTCGSTVSAASCSSPFQSCCNPQGIPTCQPAGSCGTD